MKNSELYNSAKHHRRSIRLNGYDYSQIGAYFITICSKNRGCLFGNIINGQMNLNDIGSIIEEEWLKTGALRKNVLIDEYIIMPNHIHGIIFLIEENEGHVQRAPTTEEFGKPISNSIPTIIRLFKSATTKQINEICKINKILIWQRNYYERIIRNEDELNRIR